MPFTKGQSGNPKGAPKKEWTMSSLLRVALDEANEEGISYKVLINRKLRALALKGDMLAIKELNNRIDGMPKQDLKVDAKVNVFFDPSLKQDE